MAINLNLDKMSKFLEKSQLTKTGSGKDRKSNRHKELNH